MEKNTKAQVTKFIFERFLKEEKELTKKRNWASETKAAHFLINKYGEDFWPSVNLGFKLNSLNWLRTADGLKALDNAHKKYLAAQTPEKKVDIQDVLVYNRVTTTEKSLRDRLFE